MPETFLKSVQKIADFFNGPAAPLPPPVAVTPKPQPRPAPNIPKLQPSEGQLKIVTRHTSTAPPPIDTGLQIVPKTTAPSLPPIDPKLFAIHSSGETWNQDEPLLSFGDGDATDYWTTRHASEGTLILGTTGSGKTTGSGTAIANVFLTAGFGGLVLSAKEGEAEYWRQLCIKSGREGDFIRVSMNSPWKCNLLAYEAQRPGRGRGFSENLVDFFRTLLRIFNRDSQTTNEQFWETATDQLMRSLFATFLMAGRQITIDDLVKFVISAPSKPGKTPEPFFLEIFSLAESRAQAAGDLQASELITEYWMSVFPKIPEKTRSCITLGFITMADMFRAKDVHDLLSSTTTLTPEMILSGKIVVLDLPLKNYRQVGLLVQSAFKYLFQLAVESRPDKGDSRRPVFLWEDEAQYFFSDYDAKFQQTARAYRAATVVISQNLSNFYEQFGNRAEHLVNSAFSNLNTQIFHANNDTVTNKWASERFGTYLRTMYSYSVQSAPSSMFDSLRFPKEGNTTISGSPQREHFVQPHEFAELRMGGADFNFLIDAYIYRTGRPWKTSGQQFLKVTFSQQQ